MLDETLTHLVGCLQTTLSVLEGSESAELKAVLHDHSKLPDKALAKKAAKAVDLLHRAEQLLEPGPLVLADHFLGYVNTKCLCAAVELNVADILDGKPQALDELAESSNARADRLRQVMRVLHNNGIFSYDAATDTYSNNPTSTMLLKNHWTQWRNWVDLYGNEFYDMARGIPASCRADAVRMPAQINYDTDISMFAYFQEQGWTPRLHKTLSGGAIAQGLGIAEDYPWEELAGTTFLDVGGGGGGLVALALRRHKELRAGILDLPKVIEQAALNFHSPKGEYADVGERIAAENLISGDFLAEIPPFECYTMKWCLHDWKDPGVTKILSNIRRSIIKGPRSRLVVFESLLEEGRIGRLSRYADITMMVSANGQERNEKQWRELATQSGWQVKEIYHLRNAWPCAIEMVPDWDASSEALQPKDVEINKAHTNGETVPSTNGEALTNGTDGVSADPAPAPGSLPNGTAAENNVESAKAWIPELHNVAPASTAATASSSSPERVPTKMTFLEPWDTASKGNPYYRSAPADGFPSTNFSWVDHDVVVTDARPDKASFSLDTHSFRYIDDPKELGGELIDAIRTGDRAAVERLYYPRVEEMVKREIEGAERVIIFDHTLRKRRPALKANENPDGKEQPATIVHCDQSAKGALRRLKQNLEPEDDYDAIVKNRVQMINVWRPINAPVTDWPLAQMDHSSLLPQNIHPCDLWRGEFEERGQTMTFEFAEGQRWFYLKNHRVDECTLIKIWDSADGRCCPHAAFPHPDTPADVAPRESVEVRCLVLHGPEGKA